ncbi:related to small s protein [Fusarium oxysporum]|uniref:Related to small s protein n=1 Tax=Fusarium oxysporum TaxID=5507 RepID=A0A2H3T762_FUSOX|nr:related to small s protein [Fusarium oxysporum]
MATGLEALGAASAVLQLISFAGSLASLTMKIYNGIPTAENELEDYATKMLDAAKRVESRQVPRGTSVNDKLLEVSQKCIDAAQELEKELKNVTKRYKKQKGKILMAVYSAFRADKHKAKINQLEKSLNMCKEVMETELLLKICEAKATRNAINSNTTEFRAFAVKNVSDNQRHRLLKSLKSEEIRERYNSVLPSSDACFERVFASYERVCRKDPGHKAWNKYEQEFNVQGKITREKSRLKEEVDEVDHIWERFSNWLQTDDKLFWIRGKPGSGKSTLIKFVINNGSTKRLLGSWHPNTRILSHFFWKIGSEPQNSIKGLLCSLLHDLLSEDDDAIDEVLQEFKFSQSKDFYKEWSSQEVEKILWSLLDASTHPTCIFVDGLDEISDKDGYQALLSTVQRLTSCQGVKVCVSSRPETELVKRLEKTGVQNLRLDDLTKPEMVVYLRKEFERLPKEQSTDLPLEGFTKTLLGKAQGVFLWLALAAKSVTNGIINGDDQETLSQRLAELPDELESLYQTMWERLNGNNRVYRETAARYFRFIIADGWGTFLRKTNGHLCTILLPNLVQLSLAIKVEDDLIFPPKANETKLSELNTLCAATESDIHTRCAGMLQVGRHSGLCKNGQEFPNAIYPLTRPVQFIHRTAHDFLIDTEAGQSIMSYKLDETMLEDTNLKLLKCRLNLANTYYRELEVVSDCLDAVIDCNRLNNKGMDPGAMLVLLGAIKDLYENGAMDIHIGPGEPTQTFPCAVAYYLNSFDDFVISSFMQTPSPDLATNSLYELALASQYMEISRTSVRRIRGMIELGGEAHVAKRSNLSFELPGHKMPTTQNTTAFESLLRGALNPLLSGTDLPGLAQKDHIISSRLRPFADS